MKAKNSALDMFASHIESVSEEDILSIRTRLDANGLSQAWLMERLRREYGIDIKSRSNLCDLLSGRWIPGRRGRLTVLCCLEILDRYEAVFPL